MVLIYYIQMCLSLACYTNTDCFTPTRLQLFINPVSSPVKIKVSLSLFAASDHSINVNYVLLLILFLYMHVHWIIVPAKIDK